MPKVLRVLNRLVIGGPAFNACYLTKYLPSEYETTLVVGAKEINEIDSPLAEELGIPLTVIPEMQRAISPLQDYKAYKAMKQLIKTYQPDIVHTHASKSGAIGRLAAAACGVPAIVHTYHGHVFHSYFGKLKTFILTAVEKYLAKKSHAIITISEIQYKEIVEDYKIGDPKKFVQIPLGLDLDRFNTNTQNLRRECRAALQLDEDTIAIGIVGRLVPIKQHELFIEAAHNVLQNSTKKIVFVIIGDGESKQPIMQHIEALGQKHCSLNAIDTTAPFVFTSWQTNLPYWYAGLDVVCLTSKNEGTPVSLIEAQAAKKPVISTNVGGVANVVKNTITGFVVDNNATAFANAMETLINDNNLRATMGEEGCAFVQQQFSYHRLVNDIDNLYKKLLAKA
jgi:glycosyltransferase involved in cell wall biosynthesis